MAKKKVSKPKKIWAPVLLMLTANVGGGIDYEMLIDGQPPGRRSPQISAVVPKDKMGNE